MGHSGGILGWEIWKNEASPGMFRYNCQTNLKISQLNFAINLNAFNFLTIQNFC